MYIPLLLFILMLIFPDLTKTGASTGLILWFNTILPTLLPYMIISSVISYYNAFDIVSKILYPITGKIFCISQNANYCLVIGFLCGFPMGSKVIADMLKADKISLNEASYLLSFCNNLSPAFLMNYVTPAILLNCYKIETNIMHIFYFIIFSAPILVSFIYRAIEKYNFNPQIICHKIANKTITHKSSNFLDQCILSSFDNIFKIGGYIIMFTIFSTWILNLPFINSDAGFLLSSLFEITSGLFSLKHTGFPSDIGILFVLMMCSFGGICSIAQTNSMISDTELKITSYIKYKLITAFISFILAILLI